MSSKNHSPKQSLHRFADQGISFQPTQRRAECPLLTTSSPTMHRRATRQSADLFNCKTGIREPLGLDQREAAKARRPSISNDREPMGVGRGICEVPKMREALNGWIELLEEQLPDDGQQVLIFTPHTNLFTAGNRSVNQYRMTFYKNYHDDEDNNDRSRHTFRCENGGSEFFCRVSHWRPLPADPIKLFYSNYDEKRKWEWDHMSEHQKDGLRKIGGEIRKHIQEALRETLYSTPLSYDKTSHS